MAGLRGAMFSESEFKTALIKFFDDECGVDGSGIGDDDPLFSSRLLTSLDLLDLVVFIEKELDVSVSPLEASLDVLDTIDLIINFAKMKSSST